jgi:hypothetical protein
MCSDARHVVARNRAASAAQTGIDREGQQARSRRRSTARLIHDVVRKHQEGVVMPEKPFMYSDMSERDVYRWQLDYTMPMNIGDFEAIPDDKLGWRPAERTRSAGQIFGHIIATERKHVRCILQGLAEHEKDEGLFRTLTFCDPHEKDVLRAIPSKDALITEWRHVRAQTHEYLDSITDEELKSVPGKTVLSDDDPNRHNPIREWFVMTIKHQNMAWGEIHMIRRILESSK